MKKVNLILTLLIGFGCISYAQTVTIGTQVWMTKNLDVSTFRNGEPIIQAKTWGEWKVASENKQPAWCYYENDAANGTKYGKLFNWYAVNDSRGLAPVGYHIPSHDEWTEMTNYLGSENGNKMKNSSGWNSFTNEGSKTCPNCVKWSAEYRKKVPCHTCKDTRFVDEPKVTRIGNGSNSSRFSGLPGGYRDHQGNFMSIGNHGYWWSSTEYFTIYAWVRYLGYEGSSVGFKFNFKEEGFSVRCIKD
jgi:uncharacterized protein (TIGR02145 family)